MVGDRLKFPGFTYKFYTDFPEGQRVRDANVDLAGSITVEAIRRGYIGGSLYVAVRFVHNGQDLWTNFSKNRSQWMDFDLEGAY